jgi:hypothetical protein
MPYDFLGRFNAFQSPWLAACKALARNTPLHIRGECAAARRQRLILASDAETNKDRLSSEHDRQ